MNQPDQTPPSAPKAILRSMAVLTFYALLGTGLIALAYSQTREAIDANQNNVLTTQINTLIPGNTYNNVIETDRLTLTDPAFGASEPVTIYRARMNHQPVALAITTDAPDGYGGAIRLLIAIRASDQTLLGVRVISHSETPGLGDKIDTNKDSWILGFDGKGLGNPPEAMWRVKKDGGAFDQFSGATITPRAVVNAVRRTLLYVKDNQAELFAR